MFRRCIALCLVIAAIIATSPFAQAKPTAETRYRYFGVTGSSAESIHSALVARGPTVNGEKAYGSVEMSSQQRGMLFSTPTGCELREFQLRLNFTVRLPRLTARASMSPALRSRWKSFENFVRDHEAIHRQIWMSCASSVESRVRTIRTRTCRALQMKTLRVVDETWTNCAKRHNAFDAAQRRPLLRQPFIIDAGFVSQKPESGGTRVRATRAVRARMSR